MNRRSCYYILGCLAPALLVTTRTYAQPTLPDIACTCTNNVVTLNWKNQYDGVKSITVMRSADSIMNYTMAGNVQNLKKGVQSFEDTHPYNGRNFYKLVVSFKSGLNWTTNYCRATTANHITSPEGHGKPEPPAVTVPVAQPPAAKQQLPPVNPPARPATQPTAGNTITLQRPPRPDSAKSNCNVSLTFVTDSGGATMTLPPRKKPSISTDNPDERVADLQRSKYVFTDGVTGHVKIELPDDLVLVPYGIKFYDAANKLVLDIPRLTTPSVLLDKRNFSKRGTYRFVIRKEGLEMERGYITLN